MFGWFKKSKGRKDDMATQEQIDALKAAVETNTELCAAVASLVVAEGAEIDTLKARVAELEAAGTPDPVVVHDPATDEALEAARAAVEASNAVLDALTPDEAPAEPTEEAPAEEVPAAEVPETPAE